MQRVHFRHRLALLLPILAVPVATSAQTAGSAPPRILSTDWGNGVAIAAVILLLIIGIGVRSSSKMSSAGARRRTRRFNRLSRTRCCSSARSWAYWSRRS